MHPNVHLSLTVHSVGLQLVLVSQFSTLKKGQERDQCFRCSMSRCRAYSHFPSPDLHVFTSSLHRSYEYTVVYLQGSLHASRNPAFACRSGADPAIVILLPHMCLVFHFKDVKLAEVCMLTRMINSLGRGAIFSDLGVRFSGH